MFHCLVGLLFVFSCSMNSRVFACFMLPETYSGTIKQNDHEALIVHRAGRQELVLRINYKIIGDAMPDQFAWVITVPNEPDNYKIANQQLFKDMFLLSKKLSPDSLKAILVKSKIKFDQDVWFYNNIRGNQVNKDNAIHGGGLIYFSTACPVNTVPFSDPHQLE